VEAFGRQQDGAGLHEAPVDVAHAQQLAVQPELGAAQRHDALGVQREAVVVQGALDAAGPVGIAVPVPRRMVRLEPGVHAVAPGLLRGIAARVGGLPQRGGIGPFGVYRHQADARAEAEAALVVREMELLDALAHLLGHAPRLVEGAML
jgi:hypothetical protein